MDKGSLVAIMAQIHQEALTRAEVAAKQEAELRLAVHHNIGAFNSYADLYEFCTLTTNSREEFNAVMGRLRKTWLNYSLPLRGAL